LFTLKESKNGHFSFLRSGGMNKMTYVRIGGLNDLSFVDGKGICYSIFFQGCKKRCDGCHNPEFQPFEGGLKYTIHEVMKPIIDKRYWYESVAFIGGEPLDQPKALLKLLQKVKELGLQRWLYTGYEAEEIPKEIYDLCSVIIAGEYIKELSTNGFPASSNQKVLYLEEGEKNCPIT